MMIVKLDKRAGFSGCAVAALLRNPYVQNQTTNAGWSNVLHSLCVCSIVPVSTFQLQYIII